MAHHSIVILRSRSFGRSPVLGKMAGIVGVIGFLVALANYISWIVAPSIAAVLMPINGLLWLAWWLMMSVGLFRLAKGTLDKGADSAAEDGAG